MTYYKWMLESNGHLITPTQKAPWPVEVGEWTKKETPALCKSGWHGMQEKNVLDHLPEQIGAQLWVVETKGALVKGGDKFCAPQMRLVRLMGVTTEENLRLFRCDVAEDVLPLFEKEYPNDSRPRHAIEVARRYAKGDATRDELRAARAVAGDAARAAADAAWAAARDAARAAARAARAAAGDAAWVAARDAWAAGDAAWVAAGAARDAWAASRAASRAARERYSNWLVVRIESGE